jgi:hypothetical protein
VVYDARYAFGLSDDAIPLVLASLDRLTPEEREQALSLVAECQGNATTARPGNVGWAAWNQSRERARSARVAACRRWGPAG